MIATTVIGTDAITEKATEMSATTSPITKMTPNVRHQLRWVSCQLRLTAAPTRMRSVAATTGAKARRTARNTAKTVPVMKSSTPAQPSKRKPLAVGERDEVVADEADRFWDAQRLPEPELKRPANEIT